MTYKGYIGSVEYSEADKVLFGKVLNIEGVVSYEADSAKGGHKAYQVAVPDPAARRPRMDRCPRAQVFPIHAFILHGVIGWCQGHRFRQI